MAQATDLPAEPSDRAGMLPEVVTTGQAEAQVERKTAGLQKIVISEEEIERYHDATVGDVLRRLPGVTFTGPAGVSKDARMRGLEKGYTQFLINGEMVPGASQERQMQVDRLPADMIERIEIIRNPSAELESGGIGGTINIVLKSRAENLTRLSASYGKNGHLDVGNAIGHWSQSFGDLSVILGLSHTVGAEAIVEDKQTFNAAGGLTQSEHKPRPVQKSETLITPRLTWSLGQDRLTLDPFLSRGTENKDETSEVRNASGALTKNVGAAEAKTDQISRISGRYDGKADWGNWFAKAGIQQGQSGKDKSGNERNAAGTLTKRTLETEAVQEDQSYVGAGVDLPMGSHLLKAGLEWRDTGFDTSKTVSEAKNATDALAPKAPGANDIFQVKERRAIAYVMDEWRLADAHWLIPGLRLENVDRDGTDRLGVTQAASVFAPNPSLHYRWAASPNTNFRASVAQTLKVPSFNDLNPLVSLATGADAGTLLKPDKGGNVGLRPERAAGIEAGIEQFFWNDRGVVGLNLYNRDVNDYVSPVTREENGRFVQRPHNVGNAHFWGIELDGRLPVLRNEGQELMLTGSYAELRGEVRLPSSGAISSVKDLPPRVSNLGLDWRHFASQWSAGVTINHVPTFTSDSVNPDGVREVKTLQAANLLDLYVAKAFGPASEIRLIAKNVLSVQKDEYKTKYNTDGSVNTSEAKIEASQPTLMLQFQSRF
jgi:iron complex outermembrane receptor protein